MQLVGTGIKVPLHSLRLLDATDREGSDEWGSDVGWSYSRGVSHLVLEKEPFFHSFKPAQAETLLPVHVSWMQLSLLLPWWCILYVWISCPGY